MKILVNDSNIFIDLVKLELVDIFSNLNFDLYTTDFVFEELREAHQKPVSRIIKTGRLKLMEDFVVLAHASVRIKDFINIRHPEFVFQVKHGMLRNMNYSEYDSKR